MDLGFLLPTSSLKRLVYKIVKKLLALFFLSSITAVLLLRFIPVYFTPLMLIRYHEQCKEGKARTFEKTWVPIEEISPQMYVAVLAAEDSKFMSHNGFDWEAIEEAAESNKKGGRKKGGSTISQQTAKNVFLWPGRSWVRKGLEAYFTVLIEFFWPKERILEVYLNVAETGNGVYGVEAAAQKYYKKPASKLNKTEAATIAAALRWPLHHNIGNPDKKIMKYRDGIIRNMKYVEKIDFRKEHKED